MLVQHHYSYAIYMGDCMFIVQFFWETDVIEFMWYFYSEDGLEKAIHKLDCGRLLCIFIIHISQETEPIDSIW